MRQIVACVKHSSSIAIGTATASARFRPRSSDSCPFLAPPSATRYDRLTAQGYSAPEIGERLFIGPKTVDTYKQRIGGKLGITHRAEYIAFALKLGLLAKE